MGLGRKGFCRECNLQVPHTVSILYKTSAREDQVKSSGVRHVGPADSGQSMPASRKSGILPVIWSRLSNILYQGCSRLSNVHKGWKRSDAYVLIELSLKSVLVSLATQGTGIHLSPVQLYGTVVFCAIWLLWVFWIMDLKPNLQGFLPREAKCYGISV